VEVFHPGQQRLFTFPCNDWLQVSDKEGLKGCTRTLKEGSLAAAGGARVLWARKWWGGAWFALVSVRVGQG